MGQYIVIAGAIPSVHDRKIVTPLEVLEAEFFQEGEIAELLKAGFIIEAERYVEKKAAVVKRVKKAKEVNDEETEA